MRKLNIYIILLVLLFSACESFLDEAPKHNLTLENSVTDFNGAKNILNGMYGQTQSGDCGGAMYTRLSAQGGFYNNHDDFYNMSYSQGTDDRGSAWQTWYRGINAANAAIIAISNLADNKFPSVEKKTEMIAEAKGFRAWIYSNLLWTRCYFWAEDDNEYGLLYRTEMSDLGNIQKSRITVGESYTKIFEDLDEAIAHAPDFSSSKYFSKQMAKVLKAKLLLYRGRSEDYQTALDFVLDVKGNSPSSFGMEEDMAAMYKNSWDSKEVLWARYLEDNGWRGYYDFDYAYGIIYDNEYHDTAEDWLMNDPRWEVIMDTVRAPEPWDTREFLAPVKLCRGGRGADLNGEYAAYYFRFAELYLMEAELRARINPDKIVEALKPLNDMRSMRTNPVFPELSANNHDELMDVIFKEIWTELCLENGSEYFAALRFMKDGKPWIYTLKPDVNFTEEKYIWPIPNDEMTNNKLMIQNPSLK